MKLRIKRSPPILKVSSLGPIRAAAMEFGDLTVFVGPQATGKSILVQLLKLLVDTAHIKYEFRRAGVDWDDNFELFLEVYFGEGMKRLWEPGKTRVGFNEAETRLPERVRSTKPRKGEAMFFIPAQRVLVLRDGWPQAFGYYDPGVPFTVREFSEALRLLMAEFGTEGRLFPVAHRLKAEFRRLLQRHVFCGFALKVDTQRAQKRMVLSSAKTGSTLPFMVWSAGQREFVPLLLGLFWLLTPGGAPRRSGVRWVVVEELEMGLHPRAIAVVVLMLLELVARGYRVCLSTHSPQVLDALWALKHLRKAKASPQALLEVFDAPITGPMVKLAGRVMKKTARVYYFDRVHGATEDISSLDPSSPEAAEAGWGGLSEFSARANEAVARAVANAEREGQQ